MLLLSLHSWALWNIIRNQLDDSRLVCRQAPDSVSQPTTSIISILISTISQEEEGKKRISGVLGMIIARLERLEIEEQKSKETEAAYSGGMSANSVKRGGRSLSNVVCSFGSVRRRDWSRDMLHANVGLELFCRTGLWVEAEEPPEVGCCSDIFSLYC
jgi:predicted CopG family antitoxin